MHVAREIMLTVVFWLIVYVIIRSALTVALSKSITHSAFGLFFTLVGVAGLYAFIGADFLAALQILIYVGGVLVLVIFGAMLTRRSSGTVRLRASGPPWVPLAGSLCMFLFLCTGIAKYDWNSVSTVAKREPGGLTRAIGEMLMTKYMLPFEVTSVALLAVIVAAAYLARRDEPDHPAGETK
jgi:NADH-quinone oxidoreductase subunit J